jgi:hypothetical protein
MRLVPMTPFVATIADNRQKILENRIGGVGMHERHSRYIWTTVRRSGLLCHVRLETITRFGLES